MYVYPYIIITTIVIVLLIIIILFNVRYFSLSKPCNIVLTPKYHPYYLLNYILLTTQPPKSLNGFLKKNTKK